MTVTQRKIGDMGMIDAIHLRTIERSDHRRYEIARLWIGGVPFSADLTPGVETTLRRIAETGSIELSDLRGNADGG